MKLLLGIIVLVSGCAGLYGFLFDTNPLITTGNISTTAAPDKCSIEVFANCTSALWSIINMNGSVANIDTDALRNFYCGPNASLSLQCMKDRMDPSCGPDTDAAILNKSLASVSPDYFNSSLCSNTTETDLLFKCATSFPNLKGYQDCITGETLNKSVDPTKICNLFETSLGCSYKYTDLMCPSAMNAFKKSSADVQGCSSNIDYENSPEASSCDEDIQKACDVAYKPPSYDDVTGVMEFSCSKRGREYVTCQHKVYAICKDKDGFNTSRLLDNLDFIENKTAVACSGGSTDLTSCSAQFPKLVAFQDCITGETLNKSIDPSNLCPYFRTTVGCSKKYTNLMCPENLPTLQMSSQIPPFCGESIDSIPEETSCDSNMTDACKTAYKLPTSGTGEALFDFICSGRARGYVTCAQKVNKMCSSLGLDVSVVLNSVQYYIKQSTLTCSDKSGFISYTNCTDEYLGSSEFIQCMSGADSSDICETTIVAYKCNLKAIQKTCPTTASYYKKYIYESLKACNATSHLDIPMVVASSGTNPVLSVGLLIATVSYFVSVFLQM